MKQVLGINISDLNLQNALEQARVFLNSNTQYKIFTPNPEMLVKAQKDEYFKQVLNSGDLNLCDGFGLRVFSGARRIPGIDFMLELCALAEKENKSIYLLGSGSDEVVKQCAEALNKKFVHLNVVGFDRGPEVFECHCEADVKSAEAIPSCQGNHNSKGLLRFARNDSNDQTINRINTAHPDIIFVAFGMGKQEKWICENLAKIPSVKIAMGVGGSFDYIAGAVPRAPLFLRRIGLEWIYRLFRQPKRIRRIFNATIVFIYLNIRNKFCNF